MLIWKKLLKHFEIPIKSGGYFFYLWQFRLAYCHWRLVMDCQYQALIFNEQILKWNDYNSNCQRQKSEVSTNWFNLCNCETQDENDKKTPVHFWVNASNFALDITCYRHTIKIFLARPFSTLATQYETSQNLI